MTLPVITVEQARQQGVTPSSLFAVARWNQYAAGSTPADEPEKRKRHLANADALFAVADQLIDRDPAPRKKR